MMTGRQIGLTAMVAMAVVGCSWGNTALAQTGPVLDSSFISVDPFAVDQGIETGFMVYAYNSGDAAAGNVQATVTLPSGFVVVNGTLEIGGVPAEGDPLAGLALGTLAAGSSITATFKATAESCQQLSSLASVTVTWTGGGTGTVTNSYNFNCHKPPYTPVADVSFRVWRDEARTLASESILFPGETLTFEYVDPYWAGKGPLKAKIRTLRTDDVENLVLEEVDGEPGTFRTTLSTAISALEGWPEEVATAKDGVLDLRPNDWAFLEYSFRYPGNDLVQRSWSVGNMPPRVTSVTYDSPSESLIVDVVDEFPGLDMNSFQLSIDERVVSPLITPITGGARITYVGVPYEAETFELFSREADAGAALKPGRYVKHFVVTVGASTYEFDAVVKLGDRVQAQFFLLADKDGLATLFGDGAGVKGPQDQELTAEVLRTAIDFNPQINLFLDRYHGYVKVMLRSLVEGGVITLSEAEAKYLGQFSGTGGLVMSFGRYAPTFGDARATLPQVAPRFMLDVADGSKLTTSSVCGGLAGKADNPEDGLCGGWVFAGHSPMSVQQNDFMFSMLSPFYWWANAVTKFSEPLEWNTYIQNHLFDQDDAGDGILFNFGYDAAQDREFLFGHQTYVLGEPDVMMVKRGPMTCVNELKVWDEQACPNRLQPEGACAFCRDETGDFADPFVAGMIAFMASNLNQRLDQQENAWDEGFMFNPFLKLRDHVSVSPWQRLLGIVSATRVQGDIIQRFQAPARVSSGWITLEDDDYAVLSDEQRRFLKAMLIPAGSPDELEGGSNLLAGLWTRIVYHGRERTRSHGLQVNFGTHVATGNHVTTLWNKLRFHTYAGYSDMDYWYQDDFWRLDGGFGWVPGGLGTSYSNVDYDLWSFDADRGEYVDPGLDWMYSALVMLGRRGQIQDFWRSPEDFFRRILNNDRGLLYNPVLFDPCHLGLAAMPTLVTVEKYKQMNDYVSSSIFGEAAWPGYRSCGKLPPRMYFPTSDNQKRWLKALMRRAGDVARGFYYEIDDASEENGEGLVYNFGVDPITGNPVVVAPNAIVVSGPNHWAQQGSQMLGYNKWLPNWWSADNIGDTTLPEDPSAPACARDHLILGEDLWKFDETEGRFTDPGLQFFYQYFERCAAQPGRCDTDEFVWYGMFYQPVLCNPCNAGPASFPMIAQYDQDVYNIHTMTNWQGEKDGFNYFYDTTGSVRYQWPHFCDKLPDRPYFPMADDQKPLFDAFLGDALARTPSDLSIDTLMEDFLDVGVIWNFGSNPDEGQIVHVGMPGIVLTGRNNYNGYRYYTPFDYRLFKGLPPLPEGRGSRADGDFTDTYGEHHAVLGTNYWAYDADAHTYKNPFLRVLINGIRMHQDKDVLDRFGAEILYDGIAMSPHLFAPCGLSFGRTLPYFLELNDYMNLSSGLARTTDSSVGPCQSCDLFPGSGVYPASADHTRFLDGLLENVLAFAEPDSAMTYLDDFVAGGLLYNFGADLSDGHKDVIMGPSYFMGNASVIWPWASTYSFPPLDSKTPCSESIASFLSPELMDPDQPWLDFNAWSFTAADRFEEGHYRDPFIDGMYQVIKGFEDRDWDDFLNMGFQLLPYKLYSFATAPRLSGGSLSAFLDGHTLPDGANPAMRLSDTQASQIRALFLTMLDLDNPADAVTHLEDWMNNGTTVYVVEDNEAGLNGKTRDGFEIGDDFDTVMGKLNGSAANPTWYYLPVTNPGTTKDLTMLSVYNMLGDTCADTPVAPCRQPLGYSLADTAVDLGGTATFAATTYGDLPAPAIAGAVPIPPALPVVPDVTGCASVDKALPLTLTYVGELIPGCPNCAALGLVCDEATDTCVGCLADADCADVGKVCETLSHLCVWCLTNANCSGATPVCAIETHECVACMADPDCGGDGEVCVTETQTCIPGCNDAADCLSAAGHVCDVTGSVCVECLANADCAGNANGTVCDTATKTCGACVIDGDCGSNGTCDTAPLHNVCILGCATNADCAATAATPVCDTTNGTCGECVTDNDCEDLGWTCDTAPVVNVCVFGCAACEAAGLACDVANQECVECMGASDCVGSAYGPVCDIGTHACGDCLADTDCRDGRVCVKGEHNVCAFVCEGNGDCTDEDAPYCIISKGTCSQCRTAGDCGGLGWTCNTTGNFQWCEFDCAACSEAGLVCDAQAQQCVACQTDTDCKDAAQPYCNAATNACVGCLRDADCGGDGWVCDADVDGGTCAFSCDRCNALGRPCDEANQACLECATDGDCDFNLNLSVCVAATQRCGECEADVDCGGIGWWCNAAGDVNRCVFGCEGCTAAGLLCDEANRRCVECLDDADCVGNVDGPRCDVRTASCGCADDADCPMMGWTCVTGETSTTCEFGCGACETAGLLCDAAAARCVECLGDGDCGEGLACDEAAGTCSLPAQEANVFGSSSGCSAGGGGANGLGLLLLVLGMIPIIFRKRTIMNVRNWVAVALASVSLLTLGATSEVMALPQQNDDLGTYLDTFTDLQGVGSYSGIKLDAPSVLTLIDVASPGQVETVDITPYSFSAWGAILLNYDAPTLASVQVSFLPAGGAEVPLTGVAYSQDGFNRKFDLSGVSASVASGKVRIRMSGASGIKPVVKKLQVTWAPKSLLRLDYLVDAAPKCSNSEIMFQVKSSVSFVKAMGMVVWAPMPVPTLPAAAVQAGITQNVALSFVRASMGGQYTAAATTVDGVSVPANSVYWRLGDKNAGETFILNFVARPPANTLNGTTYSGVARAKAANATQVDSRTATATVVSRPEPFLHKNVGGAYLIFNEWRFNVATTLSVNLDFGNYEFGGGSCGETYFRSVVYDDLRDVAGFIATNGVTNISNGGVYTGANPATITVGGQSITLPPYVVYWVTGDLDVRARRAVSYNLKFRSDTPNETVLPSCARLFSAFQTPVVDRVMDQGSSGSCNPGCACACSCTTLKSAIPNNPSGVFAKGDKIRGMSSVRAWTEDNPGRTVTYGETFSFLLNTVNNGASALADIVMIDKVPDDVTLVDTYLPPNLNGTVYYFYDAAADDKLGAAIAPDAPPVFFEGNSRATWWKTRAALPAAVPFETVRWVAYYVPRLASPYFNAGNGGIDAPVAALAEMIVKVRLPEAGDNCPMFGIGNIGNFATYRYIGVGETAATPVNLDNPGTPQLFATDAESVQVVPVTPNLSGVSVWCVPDIRSGSGEVYCTISIPNQQPGGAETDTAHDVELVLTIPELEVNGVMQHLSLNAVETNGEGQLMLQLPSTIRVFYTAVAPGAVKSIGVRLGVPRGTVDGSVFSVTAQVTGQDDLCGTTTGTASDSVTMDVTPYLTVHKATSVSVAGQGKAIDYTLTVANYGDGVSTKTWVVDRIPLDTTFVSAEPFYGQVWLSSKDYPDLPVNLKADFTWGDAVIRANFQPAVLSGGKMVAPAGMTPKYIAFLVDDPSLIRPQFPTETTQELEFTVVIGASAPAMSFVTNEGLVVSQELLQAVGERVRTLISDRAELLITDLCPKVVTSNEVFDYVIAYENDSTNIDQLATVAVTLPEGVECVSITHAWVGKPVGYTYALNPVCGDFVDGQLTLNITANGAYPLLPLEGGLLTIQVRPTELFPTGTWLANEVEGHVNNPAGTGEYTVFAECKTVIENADMTIRKLVDIADPIAGEEVTYTLLVANGGAHSAEGVVIRDELPAGMTYVAGSTVVGAPWALVPTDPVQTAGTSPEGGGAITVLTWNGLKGPSGVVGFVPGHSGDILVSFKAKVGESLVPGTLIHNAATIATTTAEDPELPNRATADARVPLPNLYVNKTASAIALPGSKITYVLNYGNGSKQPAEAVGLIEALPSADGAALLKFLAIRTSRGEKVWFYAAGTGAAPVLDPTSDAANTAAGWKTSVGGLTGGVASLTHIGLTIGTVPAFSGPFRIEIDMELRNPATDAELVAGLSFENCATIASSGGLADANDDDNTSCVTTRTPAVDIEVTNVCSPSGAEPGILPGGEFTYMTRVENTGTVTAYGIRVHVALASAIEYLQDDAAVVTLRDALGATVLPVTATGTPIAGAVPWTRDGTSYVIGSLDSTSGLYFRNVGLPAGTWTQFSVTGRVGEAVANETLLASTSIVETEYSIDWVEGMPTETFVGNNTTECGVTAFRADMWLEKAVVDQTTGSTEVCDGGDTLTYTVTYDNFGGASAQNVVMEDTLPAGANIVPGSFANLPAGATLSFDDGSGTWEYVPDPERMHLPDPRIQAWRITFADAVTAPAGGHFVLVTRDDFLTDGTFDGTEYMGEADAGIVLPSRMGDASYTTSIIPAQGQGNVTQWKRLVLGGDAEVNGSTLTVSILDATTSAVVVTGLVPDASGVVDISMVSAAQHPRIRARLDFFSVEGEVAPEGSAVCWTEKTGYEGRYTLDNEKIGSITQVAVNQIRWSEPPYDFMALEDSGKLWAVNKFPPDSLVFGEYGLLKDPPRMIRSGLTYLSSGDYHSSGWEPRRHQDVVGIDINGNYISPEGVQFGPDSTKAMVLDVSRGISGSAPAMHTCLVFENVGASELCSVTLTNTQGNLAAVTAAVQKYRNDLTSEQIQEHLRSLPWTFLRGAAEAVAANALADLQMIPADATMSCGKATEMRCYGDNRYGQAGVGNNSTWYYGDLASTPNVVTLDADGAWSQVSAGGFHTCAIRNLKDPKAEGQDYGSMWCWGRNTNGQLGIGDDLMRTSPVQIDEDPMDWVAVSAGLHTTCGIRGTRDDEGRMQGYGTLWCWGSNYRGKLGDGTQYDSLIPKQVGTAADWRFIDTRAETFACGIKRDGGLWCWGSDDTGMIKPNAFVPVAMDSATGEGEALTPAARKTWSMVTGSASTYCGIMTAQNWGAYVNRISAAYLTDKRPSFTFNAQVAWPLFGVLTSGDATGRDTGCQTELVNQVDVTTTTPEIGDQNNTSRAQIAVNTANLTASVTVDTAAATAGDTVTYTVTFRNDGPGTANNVQATFYGPGVMDPVVWEIEAMAPGQEEVHTVKVLVGQGVPGDALVGRVEVTSGTIDCLPSDNVASANVVYGNWPNLWVDITGPAVVSPGETVTYTITYGNNGNVVVPDAAVSYVLIDGLVFVSSDPAATVVSGGQVIWSIGVLEPGESGTITVTVTYPGCEAIDTTYEHVAAIASTDGMAETSILDNEDVTPTIVRPAYGDLRVMAIPDQSTVFVDGMLGYTVYFVNDGGGRATDVVLTSEVPLGTVYVNGSASSGGVLQSGRVVWNLGTLEAGQHGSVHYLVQAGAVTGNALAGKVSINGLGACAVDGQLGTALILGEPAEGEPLLQVVKAADVGQACNKTDDVITWSITVVNPSGVEVTDVVVMDVVTDPTLYVAGSIAGPGANDSALPNLTWAVGTLAAGAGRTVTFQTRAEVGSGQLGLNQAVVTAAGGIQVVSAPAAVRMDCGWTFALKRSWGGDCMVPGMTLDITIAYRNDTGLALANVQLVDALHEALEFVDSADGGVYDAAMRTVTFNLATVAAGARGEVHYQAMVRRDVAGATLVTGRTTASALGMVPQTSNQNVTFVMVCDDGQTCTVESCSPVEGCVVAFAPDGTSCDRLEDGYCLSGGECVEGLCNGGQIGCLIDDTCYPEGAINPDNRCEYCDPAHSETAWTTRTCVTDICHEAGVCDPESGLCRAAPRLGDAIVVTRVRDIGIIGGKFSNARAINAAGKVVGEARDFDGYERAVIWTAQDGLVELGGPAMSTGRAYGINDSDLVVGVIGNAGEEARAFLWTAAGGMDVLDLAVDADAATPVVGPTASGAIAGTGFYKGFGLEPVAITTLAGGTWVQPTAVTDTGLVVGNADNAAGEVRGFVWTATSGTADLGSLGGNETHAVAVTSWGRVAGTSKNAEGHARAFVAQVTLSGMVEAITDLGTLCVEGACGMQAAATGMNALGDVVGWSELADGTIHAFVWSSGAGMRDLGVMDALGTSRAVAINEAGTVAGNVSSATSGPNAFVWVPNYGMSLITTLGGAQAEVEALGPDGRAVGWSLTEGGDRHGFVTTGTRTTCEACLVDTEGPIVTCPAQLHRAAPETVCGWPEQVPADVYDNCDGKLKMTVVDQIFPIGTTDVLFEAEDAAGNKGQCTTVVHVRDVTPPEVMCNVPEMVVRNELPQVFQATGKDACSVNVAITEARCIHVGEDGTDIDVSDSCTLTVDGAKVEVVAPGVDANRVVWTVVAVDASGNRTEGVCRVTLTGDADTGVYLHGNGCAAGDATSRGGLVGVAALLLVLCGAWFLLRRRVSGALLGVLCVLVMGAASAEAATGGVPTQQFQPVPGGDNNYLGVMGHQVLGHLRPSFGLYLNYAYLPLSFDTRPAGDTLHVVKHQLGGDLLLAMGFFDALELGVAVPATLFQSSGDLGLRTVVREPSATVFGDIRIVPKWRIYHARERGGLALAAIVTAPTGKPSSQQGNKTWTVEPRLAFDWLVHERVRFGLNAGYLMRGQQGLFNVDVGNEFTYGLGTEIKTDTKGLFVLGEVTGKVAADADSDLAEETMPLEILGGVRWKMGHGHSLTAAAGTGLTQGYGSPTARALIGYTYTMPADTDGDGCYDEVDPCPFEPEDFDMFEDSDCCPDADNDKDGICDPWVADQKLSAKYASTCRGHDACPDIPEDADGFEDEDGCPDPDNDKDGICDPWVADQGVSGNYASQCKGRDVCPNVPEDFDQFEDEDGCPDPDNDRDRICDPWVTKDGLAGKYADQCKLSDQCPDVPETYNGLEDEDGCPDALKPSKARIEGNKIVILDVILFVFDKTEILPESFPVLQDVSKILADHPEIKKVRVEAHTDLRGSAKYNMNLSKGRAKAVMDYLLNAGIAPDRLISEGFGESRPLILKAKTEEDHQKNRRVEFTIL